MSDFIKVVRATYEVDFKISLEFNDGIKGTVDLKNELWGDVFSPLNDKSLFKQFTLTYGVLSWPNGADFAPEFLYDILKAKTQHQHPELNN
jgi:Protein of unknown function (DUF2442)